MADQKFSFSGSFQKSKEYVDTQIELIRLKAISKASRIIGKLAVDIFKLLLAGISVLFLSFALALYLGSILGSYALGFLVTAGIFIVLILFLSLASLQVSIFIRNTTIKKLIEMWDDEEDEDQE